MVFRVGDQVVLTRTSKIEEFLTQEDYTPEEYFYDRDLHIVDSITPGGNVYQYSAAIYFSEDEDFNEVELDEPESSGENNIWDPSQNPEWTWVTLAQLKELKNLATNNGLDNICRKVKQLYRKHNQYHGSAFQFQGI
jgi:hypothetical protein